MIDLIEQARLATQRAHLAGAEAAALDAEIRSIVQDLDADFCPVKALTDRWAAARRRYWRELAAAALLTGWRWEAAERLGVEP